MFFLCDIHHFLKLLFPKACSTNTWAKVGKLTDRWQTVKIYGHFHTFFFPLRNKQERLMSMQTNVDQCKRQHEWHVKTERQPKQIKSKKQTSFKSFKLFLWQGTKYTTHQLSSPELQDCPPKPLVAANLLCLYLHVWLFYMDWDLVFLPCSEVLGVCSPGTFGAVPQRRPPAQKKLHPARLAFLLLSPFHQMAVLSRLQWESRPQDKLERGKNPPLHIPGTKLLSGQQLVSTRSAANSAWTPRYKITFPGDKSGIHPKKLHCEVCAAKIINDLDWDGAVIADCGASQASPWKHSILPVICEKGSRRGQKTTKTQQKEKRESEHGLVFFRKCGAEIKTIKLGSWLKHLWEPQPCHKRTQAFKSDPKGPAPNTTSACCTLLDTGEVMVKTLEFNFTYSALLWAEEDTLPSWTNNI